MFAIIDTETTGGNPNFSRIIEIAIILHNGKCVTEEFSSLVNPGIRIPPFISALTGITDEMVASAPTFEDIAQKVLAMTENRIIVAHNAHYDYRLLKNEFDRLRIPFRRKILCTVRMSRRIFPGEESYSLGRLCKSLGIPLPDRHRAYGDASATAVLFERLMFNARGEIIESFLKSELDEATLPPAIHREDIESLPEDTGVYFFHDQNGKPLYVGKSNNIYRRVISHFQPSAGNQGLKKIADQIASVSYELTGSELVALLKENYAIKRFMPPANRMQRIKKYRYGVFTYQGEDGYYRLHIRPLNPDETPIMKITNRGYANRIIQRWIERLELHPALVGFNPKWTNQQLIEPPDVYNLKVRDWIKRYRLPWKSFVLIERGRHPNEKAFVLIEDYTFKGLGYADPDWIGDYSLDAVRDLIKPYPPDPEAHKIILRWINRHQNKLEKIIFNQE